jgi:hypothetical protein
LKERIVQLVDMFTTYAYVKFDSVVEAQAWLQENGFNLTEMVGLWIRHGGGTLTLWSGFKSQSVTVEGDMIARVYALTTLEDLGFRTT